MSSHYIPSGFKRSNYIIVINRTIDPYQGRESIWCDFSIAVSAKYLHIWYYICIYMYTYVCMFFKPAVAGKLMHSGFD